MSPGLNRGSLSSMHSLVALDVHGKDTFTESLLRIWDRGDAVLPVDLSAPRAHVKSILEEMRPESVIDAHGETRRLSGSIPVEPGDAVVISTSGTTGTPRGVIHTHDSMTSAARITGGATRSDVDSVWLACLPLAHVGGFSVICRALSIGAGLVVHDGFDADSVNNAVAGGATHISLVPAALTRIRADPWNVILLGGSAIPGERPTNSIATYGMTETFGGVVYDGRPLEGVEVRIDNDSVIGIRTPSMMRAYRTGTDPAGLAVELDGGFMTTSDIGRWDPMDRLLTVDGRRDDLIISGGVKIWPEPVEAVISAMAEARDCAVVGVPDSRWGQRVVAVIVPTDPNRPPTLESVRASVREQLPAPWAPKEIRMVTALPRTTLGKVKRGATRSGLGCSG